MTSSLSKQWHLGLEEQRPGKFKAKQQQQVFIALDPVPIARVHHSQDPPVLSHYCLLQLHCCWPGRQSNSSAGTTPSSVCGVGRHIFPIGNEGSSSMQPSRLMPTTAPSGNHSVLSQDRLWGLHGWGEYIMSNMQKAMGSRPNNTQNEQTTTKIPHIHKK